MQHLGLHKLQNDCWGKAGNWDWDEHSAQGRKQRILRDPGTVASSRASIHSSIWQRTDESRRLAWKESVGEWVVEAHELWLHFQERTVESQINSIGNERGRNTAAVSKVQGGIRTPPRHGLEIKSRFYRHHHSTHQVGDYSWIHQEETARCNWVEDSRHQGERRADFIAWTWYCWHSDS